MSSSWIWLGRKGVVCVAEGQQDVTGNGGRRRRCRKGWQKSCVCDNDGLIRENCCLTWPVFVQQVH